MYLLSDTCLTLVCVPGCCGQLKTGQNISYVIGELMYEGASRPFKFSFTIIVALCGIGVFVVFVIVCVLVMYKRKTHESSQVMKRMQSQMDVLEIRVAKECKEGMIVVVVVVVVVVEVEVEVEVEAVVVVVLVLVVEVGVGVGVGGEAEAEAEAVVVLVVVLVVVEDGIIALLLQDHRTMSTKSVCSSQ